ncbi:MAG: hypothetical protein OEX07_05815, partial [Gammaproteobacteria bacterium]|nr:hypothetical protein [Gammaproteobacteria bacterium]
MAVANASIENQPDQNFPATDVPAGMPVPVENNQLLSTADEDEGNIISNKFRSLSRLRQIQLLISTAAIIAIVTVVFMWSSDPNYKLLYGNLTIEAAG